MSKRLQNNKEVVLAAALNNPEAFKYAGDILRNSRQVVEAAVLKNHFAFMYASKRLQNSKEFILELIAVEPRISRFLSKELQEDVDVKRALSKNEENWDDVGFVFAQVLENPRLFENASDRLKGWKGFVLQLIRSHMEVVEESRRNGFPSTQYKAWIFRHFASEGLQNDKDIKSAALMRIVI